MPRIRVSPPVQPETSFEVGEDEAWKANLKVLTDLCLTPGITNQQNIISNFQTLFGQGQKLEAKLDNALLTRLAQAAEHSDEMFSERQKHYANVNTAAVAALTSLITQVQRQGDVGATALFYNIPSKAIDASVVDDVKNMVSEAMKTHSDAITKALKDMTAAIMALYQALGLKPAPEAPAK